MTRRACERSIRREVLIVAGRSVVRSVFRATTGGAVGDCQAQLRKPPIRSGTAILELSIVLVIVLLLTAGTLELGIAVFRHNLLSEAARQGARRAIVHGSMAPNSWGPNTIDVPATANGIPIVDGALDGIQPLLVAFDLVETRIRVQWLDGSNELEARVRVTVTTPYTPVILFFLSEHDLSASSTMPIAH